MSVLDFKNSKFLRLVVILCCSGMVMSCERKMDKSAQLQIQLPYTAANQMTAKAGLSAQTVAGGVAWGVSDPANFNDISCFAIAVEAPDLNQFRCIRSDGSIAMRPGVLVGTFPAGSRIEVDVPAGPDRRIHAIGFAATSPDACKNFDTNDGPNKAHLSAPHMLGSVKRNLDPGPATVVITASLSAAGKFHSCDKPNFGELPDDSSGSPNLMVMDSTVTEGSPLSFDFVLDATYGSDITISFNVADGTALGSGVDYSGLPGAYSITILSGQTIANYQMTTVQDFQDEPMESMSVSITSALMTSVIDDYGVGSISDDDAPPTVSLSDSSVTEGGEVVFLVTLSQSSGFDVGLSWVTSDISATSSLDYSFALNTYTIVSGGQGVAITVPTVDDGDIESTETFMVSLYSLVNVIALDDVGIGTITDNDGMPSISISDASGTEGQSLSFLVTMSQIVGADVTFEVYTSDGTALSATDYGGISFPTPMTIAAGLASTWVYIPTIDDGISEATESFDVYLQSLSGASAADIVGQGTILDNDVGAHLYVLDTSVTEGGTAAVMFSLSAASGSHVDIGFTTYDSSAIGGGTDFIGGSFSVQIPAGQTFAIFDIGITDDGMSESSEIFMVSIDVASNVTIADGTAIVTINDDDSMPGLWMGTPLSVMEGQSAVVGLNLDSVSASDVTVNLLTDDGTASSGAADYTSFSGTVTIGAGITIVQISITTHDDVFDEYDEFFNVSLSSLGGASLIGSGFAAVSIADNDPEPQLSINDSTHLEGQSLMFQVSMSQISGRDVSFNISTFDIMATSVSLSDYSPLNQTVTIPAGNIMHSFTVNTTNDTLYEPVEDFGVTLTSLLYLNPSLSSTGAKGIIRDEDGWSVNPMVTASNGEALDIFGVDLNVDGSLIVVGASQEDSNQTTITQGGAGSGDNSATSAGSAYVYRRVGNSLVQQAYLKAPNAEANDRFGASVGVDGSLVVVAATGESSNQTTINQGASGSADNSLSMAGAVYLFRDMGGTWVQEAYLKPSHLDASDNFGVEVAASADMVAVGAYGEGSNQTHISMGPASGSADNSSSNSGAVYVFHKSGGSWAQMAMLKASNAEASDSFGARLDMFGSMIVVGAYAEDSSTTTVIQAGPGSADNSATSSGAAYIYRLQGGSWVEEAYLKAANANANDYFGYSVAAFANMVVVGAQSEQSSQNFVSQGGAASADNSMTASGAAYVYENMGGTWSQTAYLKPTNPGDNDKFGFSVAATYKTVVVGAPTEDSQASGVDYGPYAAHDDLSAESGAVYVFQKSGGSWSQVNYIKAPANATLEEFGDRVDIDGDLLVVGARKNDSLGNDAGAIYHYNWRGPMEAIITRDPAQPQTASGFPVVFHVRFSRPINDGTFAVADLVNSGTATGVTWTITNSGDSMNYIIQATAGPAGGVTYLPSVPVNAVMDNEGMGNNASTTIGPTQVTQP